MPFRVCCVCLLVSTPETVTLTTRRWPLFIAIIIIYTLACCLHHFGLYPGYSCVKNNKVDAAAAALYRKRHNDTTTNEKGITQRISAVTQPFYMTQQCPFECMCQLCHTVMDVKFLPSPSPPTSPRKKFLRIEIKRFLIIASKTNQFKDVEEIGGRGNETIMSNSHILPR